MSKGKKAKVKSGLEELEQLKIQHAMAEAEKRVHVDKLREAYGMPELSAGDLADMSATSVYDPKKEAAGPGDPFHAVWAEDLKKAYMDSLKIRTPPSYLGPGTPKVGTYSGVTVYETPRSLAETLRDMADTSPAFKTELEQLATHMVTLEKQVEELKVAKRIAEENAETFLANLDAERECIRDLRDQLDSARALADEYYKDRELARDTAIEILDALEEERGGEDGQTRRAKAALA